MFGSKDGKRSWRRKRDRSQPNSTDGDAEVHDVPTASDVDTGPVEITTLDAEQPARPDGEPSPSGNPVAPADTVLDELSRAFGNADEDNAALIADDTDDPGSPVAAVDAGEAARDTEPTAADPSWPDLLDPSVSTPTGVADTDADAETGRDAETGVAETSGVADSVAVADAGPSDGAESESSGEADSEPIDLVIVTSDDPASSGDEARDQSVPSERKTIVIGDPGDGVIVHDSAAAVTGPSRDIESEPGNFETVDPDRSDGPDRSGGQHDSGGPDDDAPVVAGPGNGSSTIAIGEHDDLPDVRYLDEELGDIGEGTVFIDDDGEGDAIAVKDATGAGIEPRIRQRRISVRRAASRKRLKWVALALLVLLVVGGVLALLGSSWFAIEEVDVAGAVYTDENRLQLVIDELVGTPALLADTEAAERELEAIPWVEQARVRVDFPHNATIEIRERSPVATMAGADGRFRVLDDQGRVLDVIEGQPVAFILLGGPSTLDLAAGQFAPVGPSAAASLVTKLTPTIRPRVERIDVLDDGSELVMYLTADEGREQTDPIRVRFGSAIDPADQFNKLVRLEDRLDDLPDGPITEINVATEEVTVL